MADRNRGLGPSEYWVTQLDPETGRLTQTVEQNWFLSPFYGLWEIVSDIGHRRMSTADTVFLVVILVLMARGLS